MPEWNPRANDIFVRAAEIETAADRRLFVEQQCNGDAALRAQVESLLVAGDQAESFLKHPAVSPRGTDETGAYRPLTEGPGTVIGPYKLLQHIGEGGFGAVYMAEQEHPVRRKVALKIIKPGMDTREVIARFESERQALALMDHPNIARVFDAGATESGRPYFVMELVRGVPITEFCDRNKLPADGRLRLFVTVCHAIQHAHHKGVIHRDVKPSNVMVTLHDGVPVVKVIDFGVAKATAQKLTERTLFTAYGQMVGTPAYMSPEQAEMSGLDIDTRSDIYSLGVLLYELLTGTTPLDLKQLRQAGYAEMQRLIREEEAPRPSTRFSSLGGAATVLATNRGTDVRRLSRLLRSDLDWIVMKSLEKDRNRRYGSPANFAADVERFLTEQPVEARAPSAWYRARKFARRNKVALTTTVLVATALVVGTALSLWQAVAAGRAETAALAERDEKEKARLAEAEQRAAAVKAAGDASRSEEAAKASELRALAGEQKAKDSLEEAERTLVESLLRPVGQGAGPLGALELAALGKLAGLSDGAVRLRFLRTGLDDAESARRLGLRAEPVVRAVVGLDRQRKRAVEGLLLERLRRPGLPRDTILGCLALAAALSCEDEHLADLGTQRLVELAGRPNFVVREFAVSGGLVQQAVTFVDQTDLRRVVAAADGLTGGLSPARAGAHAESILTTLNEKSDEKRVRDRPTEASDEASLDHLATLLQSVLKRLPSDRASGHATAAVTTILTTSRRRAVTSQTVLGNGRGVERVNYAPRARMIAGLAPWITIEPREVLARAVLAEMGKAAADPDARVQLTNKLQAVRQLVPALRALLPELPRDRAERHAAEAVGLLLTARDREAAETVYSDLADGARELAPYLPAAAAVRLADALSERLAAAPEVRDILALGSALQALLDQLPPEQAGNRADKAAEALVTALAAAVEKPAPAAPERPFGGSGRRPGFGLAPDPDPVVQLAVQLSFLLRQLPSERAGEYATRAAKVLIPAFLEPPGADSRLADRGEDSPLLQAIRAVSEQLPAREAQRHVEPWLAKALARPSNNASLLIAALAERLPTSALLAALAAPLGPTELRTQVAAALQRRAETMPGAAADQLFGEILALRRTTRKSPFVQERAVPEDVRVVLKVLAGRVSADQVPGHADRLLERIAGTPSRQELVVLTETLDVLLSRLPAERASELAAKATEAVISGITRAQPSGVGGAPRPVLGDLDKPLTTLANRVPPAQVGRHVESLLGAMGKARRADDLCNGARGVLSLVGRLPPADRERAVARAVQLLLPALRVSTSASEFALIAGVLELVGDRFPVRTGEEHARAAMRLVEKAKRGAELPPLAEAYRVVLARLPDGAAPHAEAFAGYVVRTAAKTRSPLDLVALAKALRSVGGSLPTDSTQAEALASLLFQRWDEAPEEILTEQIGEAIQAVAPLLPAGRVGPAADRVLAVLSKVGDRDRRVLTEVHEALIRRLPDDQARPRRVAVLRACLHAEALGASPGPFRGAVPNPAARSALPAYLAPLVTPCTPGDLMEVLTSPACVGEVQGWLLAELGRRWGREFHSVWDLPPAR